jgi:hypothetical protein
MTIETGTRGFGSELAIRGRTALDWGTIEPLTWTGERDTFTVPIDFITDFATSPRFLHWLWLPYGAYTRAAVLHDYLLWLLKRWMRANPETRGPCPVTSRDADAIFRVAMRDLGVGKPKRWLGWTAVRWGALFNPDRAYGRDFLKDAPRVLGVSLLVLATVLIPVAAFFVLLALGGIRLFTALSGGTPNVRRTARRGRLVRFTREGNDHV